MPHADRREKARLAELRREGARKKPWTQGILRALELDSYRSMSAHEPGWIAGRLGISMAEEADCLAFLLETDQVAWTGTTMRGERWPWTHGGGPRSGRA